jgi:hypothetical protein
MIGNEVECLLSVLEHLRDRSDKLPTQTVESRLTRLQN